MERSGSFVYNGDSETSEQEKRGKEDGSVPPSSSGTRKGMEGRVIRGTRGVLQLESYLFTKKNNYSFSYKV